MVERDGFSREEMEERGPERFPREEDIDTALGVGNTATFKERHGR